MKQQTALLVMDMQAGILERMGDTTALLANVANAISTARENMIPVFYVTLAFRPGLPEVHSKNGSFAAYKPNFLKADMQVYAQIPKQIAPLDGDILIIKKRISAFTGSDLELVLRSMEISNLVLTGIATSGVVLSTLRDAVDKDYNITVLSDCCKDQDEEVHHVLLTKLFKRQANVYTLGEWIETLSR